MRLRSGLRLTVGFALAGGCSVIVHPEFSEPPPRGVDGSTGEVLSAPDVLPPRADAPPADRTDALVAADVTSGRDAAPVDSSALDTPTVVSPDARAEDVRDDPPPLDALTPDVSCPAGSTVARDLCVSLQSDARNCGEAGHACAASEACVEGACACRAGLTRAAGACVDLQSSPSNCGSIGARCNSGSTCLMGACTPTGMCRSPHTNCSGACVNVNTSPSHCGRCGAACATDEVCVAGRCRGYVALAGCAACPCACARGTTCCALTTPAVGVCVEGAECPM